MEKWLEQLVLGLFWATGVGELYYLCEQDTSNDPQDKWLV
jgi:hypothetical protein